MLHAGSYVHVQDGWLLSKVSVVAVGEPNLFGGVLPPPLYAFGTC